MVAEVRREGLTFGDVLIIPKYSDIESRTTIDVNSFYLGKERLPIISAPMDYVTGPKMALKLAELGAYGVVSRFGEPVTNANGDFAIAVGTKSPEWEWDLAPSAICIDVAHGDHKNVIDAIKRWKDWSGGYAKIIAGNVATREGFERLAAAGADAVRVGIGPGSACSTRENTGIGIPQLSAIMDCATRDETWSNVSLIADGGIQTPGDIAKALAAGADAVMLGRMLAGHDESPGEVITYPEDEYRFGINIPESFGGLKISADELYGPARKLKAYRGQSLLGSNGKRNAPEGVEGYVEYKGPVENTISSLMNYLRSSMSYVGARNLTEFRQNAEFIKVSPATFDESRTRL